LRLLAGSLRLLLWLLLLPLDSSLLRTLLLGLLRALRLLLLGLLSALRLLLLLLWFLSPLGPLLLRLLLGLLGSLWLLLLLGLSLPLLPRRAPVLLTLRLFGLAFTLLVLPIALTIHRHHGR
jgi:hypothetical protein